MNSAYKCDVHPGKVRFGYKYGLPQWCSTCRPADAVNLDKCMCRVGDCTILASFGIRKPAIHCAMHRLPGEVNVAAKKCEVEGCTKNAAFGISTKIRCKTHQLPGMINIQYARVSKKPDFKERQRRYNATSELRRTLAQFADDSSEFDSDATEDAF